MSAGYASRLRSYPHKGVCGLPESVDTARTYHRKLQAVVAQLDNNNNTHHQRRVVIMTGAGISTAAGIPDFRGPKGIWTLEEEKQKKQRGHQKKKKKRKRGSAPAVPDVEDTTTSTIDFASAEPTLTHRAITHLVQQDPRFRFCITQNVDGLHRRSGLSRQHHAILHGCVCTETCSACGLEHFRDHDVGGMSFQPTGRKCDDCGADLIDTLLDWEDPLPEDDWQRAQDECSAADLVLCLGTSLRIEPAGQLPLRAKSFVIVNLQQTPIDGEASIVIREKVDTVMADLMEQLGYDKSWQSTERPPIERHWKMEETTTESESPSK